MSPPPGFIPSPAAKQATELLTIALGSAMDNLPDVVNDSMFPRDDTMACCTDIAALSFLLTPGKDGVTPLQSYL